MVAFGTYAFHLAQVKCPTVMALLHATGDGSLQDKAGLAPGRRRIHWWGLTKMNNMPRNNRYEDQKALNPDSLQINTQSDFVLNDQH